MELIFILAAFLIAALVSFFSKQRGIIEYLSVIAAVIAFVISIIVALHVSSSGVYAPYSFFSVDALGAIIMLIIGFVGVGTVIYSIEYLRKETAKNIIGITRVKQYFILLNLFLAAMFLATTASSPIFTWIAIEATTLSTAFLISFYNKPLCMEAAWKYLIINSVGLLLGFFGTLLYFTSIETIAGSALISWQQLLANASHLDPMIAKIAFIFVLIGYGTKVGLAPMHTWLPDAHSKAPSPISALLSGVLLNVAFIAVLRFKAITDSVIGHLFSQNIFIIFGLLSIIVAVCIIFNQKSYKRLLAYSSIENMGLITVGFGFGGVAAYAAILHMIYHSLVKSALFLSSGNLLLKYRSAEISNIKGALNVVPVTSGLFIAGFLAITGIPPFGIFLTKISILSVGIQTHPVISIVAFIFMTILFIGFLKHVAAMVFGAKPTNIEAGEESIWLIIPPLTLVIVLFCLSFYIPPFLVTLLNDITSHY